ncbi:terminase small subunit [Methylopila sp. M107]|uniref:terminase small subunit n=1 Tax=Methylopila sp. M107 TaxID=1101190 RepID=UPI0009DC06AE|nr:terminase small subunit [Methylopila sp. M107]
MRDTKATLQAGNRTRGGSLSQPQGAGLRGPDTSVASENAKGTPLPLEGSATGAELAGLLGIAPRSVRSLAERGVVVRAGRGRYALAASITAYCESLRQTAAGRGGDEAVASLSAERYRLAREQADAMAIKNALSRKQLVSAFEVEKVWRETMQEVRTKLLTIPSRIQQRMSQFTAVDIEAIRLELFDVLHDLAQADQT